ALVNFLASMRERPGLSSQDRVLAVTPLSFDISGLELWLPLLAGATIELVSRETATDGELLRRRLADVTLLQATPATWHLLLAAGWEGGDELKALCGGEALSPQLAARLLPRAAATWNMYGPTETTIWSSLEAVGPEHLGHGSAVSIGRPIANTRLYVVDPELRPQPLGVAGELLIGGAGLARGYRGRPALTADRFVPDPLSSEAFADVAGQRLYRTGDLARWREDGELEYLGRIDHQVKLRGFRIELGEIESVLVSHEAVTAAVVALRGAAEEARLVAYLVPAGAEPDLGDLRRHLRSSLPEYMVPAAFVMLPALPLSPGGKVDRRALPEPGAARPEASPAGADAAPRGELEEALAGVWRELLGMETVGLFDNFFDVGGHSLLLVQVRSRVRELLGRDIPLVDLFRYPTIRSLVDHLSGGRTTRKPRRAVAPSAAVATGGGEIAIIGMDCRFVGAESPEDYWRNLCGGLESIRFLNDEELAAAGVDRAIYTSPNYVRANGDVKDPVHFDAAFFGFSPREAEVLDPQHRIFLECAYHALESAGCDPERFPGNIAVFAGTSMSRYAAHVFGNPEIQQTMGQQTLLFSTAGDYLASRVSYKLNLTGPAVVVQTACSTSLVAAHLASRALREGECDMALVGGVAVQTFRPMGYEFVAGGMVSPDGHCRAFDAGAKGTVFCGGVGAVALKRLEDALAGGDRIQAVIKGSAINNDGSLKIGYTAPGADGQARVIRSAHLAAGVESESIRYVETHGTGTSMGDPIEVDALTRAFATEKRGFCAIGSAKTNIGHTDTAAGVAALIKATLAVEHALLPPSLNFEEPNPNIDFPSTPFYVQTELERWESNGTPRRAGVSSFGIGGTNAHIILEQTPEIEPSGPSRPWQLLVVSARTPSALETMTDNLAGRLREHPELTLADVAFTLQVGRTALPFRRMLVCADPEDAASALEARERKRVLTRAVSVEEGPSPVVFLFPGQGAQYAGMGRELYATEPVFRAEIDRCCELLEPHLGLDLRRLLHPAEEEREEADAKLQQTQLTQPALFVVEYALARLWMAWGVEPEAMLGHSIGEYVAAALAGVLPLPEALRLVAVRGRLMQETPHGAMLSVPLPEAEIRPLLGEELSLAAANSPTLSVVSGPTAALETLEAELTRRQVKVKRLRTSHAFHSALMEPVLDRFREEVARVPLKRPEIPWLSNLTGNWIRVDEATDPDYWVRHLRGAVRFSAGVGELLSKPEWVLLEVGPGRTLQTLVRQHPEGRTAQAFSSLNRPRDRQPEAEQLMRTLGQLWLAGVDVDWTEHYAGERRLRVSLPTYPFERQRYWVEPSFMGLAPAAGRPMGKKEDLAEWFYVPFWKPSVMPSAAAEGDEGRRWLLLLDECGLGAAIARRLAAAGAAVVTAEPGEAFAELGPGRYALRPTEVEDHEALIARLRKDGGIPGRIVHLGSVTAESAPEDPASDSMLEQSFYSLLSWIQALGRQGVQDPIELGVVSTGVQSIDGREAVWPEKAALLGPCLVIPEEYPHIHCRAVDVVLDDGLDEVAAQLIAEMGGESAERVIAHRGPARWVRSFEPALLDQALDDELPLRSEGVYLITGGLGGLGLVFARYLAETLKARLVLTGRSSLPDREGWDEWLSSHGGADPTSHKIRRIRDLEELGAEVLVCRADAGDEAAMRRAIAAGEERFGVLHGVIHAAGIAGGGVIQLKTREMAAAVLEPKVRGTRVLDTVLGDAPLDFLLLCSSITALQSTLGQVDYCAANNVLDAYARHLRLRRPETRTVSVNWGPWSEVGMAAEATRTWVGDEPAELPGEEVGHPLIHRRVAGGEQVEYVSELVADDHWVLSEHLILDTPTVPGATYLEMARAAFADHTGAAEVELREILFLSPLAMSAGERREVRTILEASGDGFDFRVTSRLPGGDEEQWLDHARGRIAPLPPAEPRRWELDELLARCSEKTLEGDSPSADVPDLLVTTGPRWKSLKRVHRGSAEALAVMELGEEFAGDFDDFVLHPALLDIATGLCRDLAEWKDYLPASYHRVEARRPLPRKLYAYVRDLRTRGKGELFSVDLTLLDEQGVELVAVEEFTMKRVGEAADRLVQPPPELKRPAAEAPAMERTLTDVGIAPAEGVEALRRILSRHRGPQIVAVAGDVGDLVPAAAAALRPQAMPQDALPPPAAPRERHERPAIATDYVAPRNALETRLAEMWQELLGLEKIGVYDEFIDLGGHSLLAMQMYTRLQESLGVTVSLPAIFEAQTIAELAEVIGEVVPQEEPAVPAIVALPRDRELLREAVPLSFAQERLWFLAQLDPASAAYNLSLAYRLTGTADVRTFARTLDEIVRRHEALRTTFVQSDTGPVQEIAPPQPVPFGLVDLSGVKAEAEARQLLRREAARPFDLTRDLMLRVQLLRVAGTSENGEHILLVVMHHIAADYWSWMVFQRELLALYSAFSGAPAASIAPPPALPVQYADFAVWQRQWLAGEVLAEQIGYWTEQLGAEPPVLELPADRPRPPVETYVGARIPVELEPAVNAGIQALGREHGVTVFMTMLAAFQALLHRYTGQEDLIVGTPVAGRSRPEVEGLIGVFINNLALRIDLGGDPEFRTLLERAREVALGAFAHQDLPFEKLVEALRIERDLSRAPLFQVMFILQTAPVEGAMAELPGMTLEVLPIDQGTAIYDLTVALNDMGDLFTGWLEYNTDLFDAATIARMADHYLTLVRGAAAAPETRLSELPLLAPPERHQLLAEWNATESAFPDQRSLHELITERSERHPEAVAVVCENSALSYRELERRSDLVAGWLVGHGVRAESLVGITLEPGPELVVALVGVLKAGGAYLPLDPSYPRERLAHMLEDSGAAIAITREHLLALLPEFAGATVCLDRDWDEISAAGAPPTRRVAPESLAYVIYTSGSTGKPKGVEISHRALVNFLESMRARPGLDQGDRLLAVTPLSFDISGLELYLPLVAGATVELVSRATAADGELLAVRLATATHLQATPATWHLLVADGWRGGEGLKALCGGEALSPRLAAELVDRTSSTWNMYGPTETTIWSSVHAVKEPDAAADGAVSIGRPIANTRFQVVDRGLRPQPEGVPGELLIGGAGLARGYRGRPALSAERFIPDPFAAQAGARLYRTGDLARWRPDGRMEYLGRLDHQIKLRGFRIELGEIESVLTAHPAVAAAVVVLRGEGATARLVAYAVPAGAEAPAADALRRHLRASLPEYMVPAAFVTLEELPLLPNGKVNRRALPEPESARPEPAPAYEAPVTELEQTIAGIWQEVLEVETVGLSDNFFDVGGHSLLLAQVRSRLREHLGRELPLMDLFRHPSIRTLADYLSGASTPARVAPAARRAVEPDSELAIVGMSCRFPGAENVDEFWSNLCDGQESIRVLSDQELEAAGIDPSVYGANGYVRAAAGLKDPDRFDAAFFGFSPREAETLDPQQRIFLECAWQALETAGYDPGRYPGRVGVYAGSGMSRYAANVFSNRELMEVMDAQALTFSVAQDYLASRVSYKLNLTGPSMVVQTACSTSLVATHLARQALLEGECDMALVGGVTLIEFQPTGYPYVEGGIRSPDGHCRAFDAEGRGTVFSSGAGIVVLKRLADAVADGDTIHALVKGTAVNNDGAMKIGYTAPSEEGQAEVIATALATAQVAPETIGYVEAHGTGTALGDPIEVSALSRAFQASTENTGFCAIGSVKTNIGHTDTAAGAAGLIKTALALEHGQLPPSLNFERPNPEIDFDNSPFRVVTELRPWERNGAPRRAGVSSFGIGGTNAHAVLEEPPPVEPSGPSRPWQLLLLSARTESALEAMTDNLARHLGEHPDLELADVAFTLQVGRAVLPQRRMLVCRDAEDAVQALAERERKRVLTRALGPDPDSPPVVFLFPGQGAQYAEMGRELYRSEPVYRTEVDRCCELLQPHLGIDLREVLHAEGEGDLDQTAMTQPALFVVEYALARLWMAWGIRPEAMLGHSIGEYVAACLAGVLTLPEALRLVAARGRLMQETAAGAMASVALPEAELVPLLGEELSLAAVNGPSLCTVSGPPEALEALQAELAERQVKTKLLRTSHAFHSALMEPVLDRFREELAGVTLKRPQLRWLSNLTGTWIRDQEATDPEYWVRHLRSTVRFAAGVEELLSRPERVILEAGPGRTLQTLVRQHPEGKTAQVFSSLPPRGRQPEPEHLLRTLGQLWLAGVTVDWTGFPRRGTNGGFSAGERRLRVPLPSYPFDRQRYWIEPGVAPAAAAPGPGLRKREDVAEWFSVPYWKPSGAPAASVEEGPGRWLLLVDECGLGEEMARQLREAGETAVTVRPGEAFARLEPESYAVRPAERADYETLFAELGRDAGVPPRIVHLWTVTPDRARGEPMLERSFYSLVSQAQALAGVPQRPPVELGIVSTGVQTVGGQEPLWAEKAALLGPCGVIPKEYPDVRCRSIDVLADHLPAVARQLIAELRSGSPETVVAYRGRTRWVRDFAPAPLESTLEDELGLRPQGVYLITGGLGGLGLVFARHLAEACRARLVLTDRDRDKIRGLEELEELGAEVLACQADVGDEEAMRRVIDDARERFGAVHGVIHAAGNAGGGPIQLKQRAAAEAVLQPKVEGVRVLERVLDGESLDFFVLFSSTTALVAELGQVDACAADNVLDAFAREYQARRPETRTVAIDWGAWDEEGIAP
ncbi:MAG: amino acid adenylation domain-containing protein, partial [bacterium]|nr:amino acid adenylation domain-containing protein [bacterium]